VYARRTGALDDLVISLTAKGLTSGEIVSNLAQTYGRVDGGRRECQRSRFLPDAAARCAPVRPPSLGAVDLAQLRGGSHRGRRASGQQR
jgi:hypothetical protein